jgi:hypothetical protein
VVSLLRAGFEVDVGAEFLDKMRQKLGPMLFAQEFEGEFIDAESSIFSSEIIELNDFEKFIP